MITEKQLKTAMPAITQQNIEKYLPELNDSLPKYEIDTPLRIAHFLSQVGHESCDFVSYRENLNYSAERLEVIFRNRFDLNHDHILSVDEKKKITAIARNPKATANFVYAGINGNGDEKSGDGFRFIGRGAIQITGRDNYAEASEFIFGDDRLLTNPELLELPKYGILAACWFWTSRGLNALADKDDCTLITRKINGGTNGIEDRRQRLLRAKKAFGI